MANEVNDKLALLIKTKYYWNSIKFPYKRIRINEYERIFKSLKLDKYRALLISLWIWYSIKDNLSKIIRL